MDKSWNYDPYSFIPSESGTLVPPTHAIITYSSGSWLHIMNRSTTPVAFDAVMNSSHTPIRKKIRVPAMSNTCYPRSPLKIGSTPVPRGYCGWQMPGTVVGDGVYVDTGTPSDGTIGLDQRTSSAVIMRTGSAGSIKNIVYSVDGDRWSLDLQPSVAYSIKGYIDEVGFKPLDCGMHIITGDGLWGGGANLFMQLFGSISSPPIDTHQERTISAIIIQKYYRRMKVITIMRSFQSQRIPREILVAASNLTQLGIIMAAMGKLEQWESMGYMERSGACEGSTWDRLSYARNEHGSVSPEEELPPPNDSK
jgi:hypothetical protein